MNPAVDIASEKSLRELGEALKNLQSYKEFPGANTLILAEGFLSKDPGGEKASPTQSRLRDLSILILEAVGGDTATRVARERPQESRVFAEVAGRLNAFYQLGAGESLDPQQSEKLIKWLSCLPVTPHYTEPNKTPRHCWQDSRMRVAIHAFAEGRLQIRSSNGLEIVVSAIAPMLGSGRGPLNENEYADMRMALLQVARTAWTHGESDAVMRRAAAILIKGAMIHDDESDGLHRGGQEYYDRLASIIFSDRRIDRMTGKLI